MTHVVDDYKAWQPKYAAYASWGNKHKRQEQAIREMVAEAGEVEGVVAKANRKGVEIPQERILDELGDVWWGLVGVMNEFDISWEELTSYNVKKLTERNA